MKPSGMMHKSRILTSTLNHGTLTGAHLMKAGALLAESLQLAILDHSIGLEVKLTYPIPLVISFEVAQIDSTALQLQSHHRKQGV
eukprot:scaffold277645_cov43-Prasinocladus_malaysianus.AAC.1